MKITGAKAVIQSLINEKVEVIFGYPGGANMPIYDALYDYQNKIRHILVRHEQGAAHAAEGYARVSGKVGVCFATSGPGATNLVTGIADAMMDSVPLVCITGQVPVSVVGTDAFQETDVIGITTPITKWNYQITSAQEIADVFAKAFYIARTGRPGPVVIDITKNAQFEEVNFSYPKNFSLEKYKNLNKFTKEEIEKAADIINQSKKPLIIAGHGVIISGAQNELLKLAEKANLPISVTLHGLSTIPVNHPLYVGMVGMHGNYAVNKLTNQADLIIGVGMRFDDRVTSVLSKYAPKAKVIHIDIDEAEIDKNIKTTVSLVGEAKNILKSIFPFIKKNSHQSWFNEFNKLNKEEEKIHQNREKKFNNKITMDKIFEILSKKTNGKAIIVADVGQNQMFAAKYYQYKTFNSYITSGGLGTMGFALPAAIGVQLAKPKDLVIASCGDGGLQMTIQEFGTIMQEKLPIKILLLNNSYLGMVRQWQDLFFEKRYSFTYIKNPDFLKIAQGYGIKGKRINDFSQLEKSLEEFINEKSAYLLEVIVEKEHNVFPMVPQGAAVDEVRLE
jgi:acetolactate synthase-1/2/3 large subunit